MDPEVEFQIRTREKWLLKEKGVVLVDYPDGAPLWIVRAGEENSLCMVELGTNGKFTVRGANGELVYEAKSQWVNGALP